jgi:hypothetical protein
LQTDKHQQQCTGDHNKRNFSRTSCEKTRIIIEALTAIIYKEPSYKAVKVSVTRKAIERIQH